MKYTPEYFQKQNPQTPEEEEKLFEQYIEMIEDPDYEGRSQIVLAKDANQLDQEKYEICQRIFIYQRENNLSVQQLSNQLNLTEEQTEDIIYGYFFNLTLKELEIIAEKMLFKQIEQVEA